MPRETLKRSNVLPYHVGARVNHRKDFPIPLDQMWDIIAKECLFLSMIYGVEFQSFVLMPNHFHTILTVPNFDLGTVMSEFMKSVSKAVGRLSGQKGHLFGGPHFRTLITNSRYFGHAYKYVYRNPVKAGLCNSVEHYPYSTLRGIVGEAHLPFPIHYTRSLMEVAIPPQEENLQLRWLNKPFPKEADRLIQKALKKNILDVILSRETQEPIELLDFLL